MKRFLTSLLTCYTRLEYHDSHRTQRGICQTQNQSLFHWNHSLNSNGNQEKLQFVEFLLNCKPHLWRSLTVLTVIPRSLMSFSNTLSRYWQSSFIISPALLQVVEGRPLIHLKAIGVIWMISNISMPVKRSGELLHIFGGV